VQIILDTKWWADFCGLVVVVFNAGYVPGISPMAGTYASPLTVTVNGSLSETYRRF
jgi:hypothetical protein